jgi:hypothetical protein
MNKHSFKPVLRLGVVFLTSACLWTALADETNTYLSISDRNPFGLKPPPPAQSEAPPPAPPAAPAATIKLTGITSIIGPPKALFEITEPGPGKTPRKPILSAKERDGDLEVVSINIDKSEVTIRNAGVLTNITFTPIETAAAAPAGPGGPPKPGGPVLPPSRGGTAGVPPAAQGGPVIVSRAGANQATSRNSVTLLGGAAESAPGASPTASRVGPTYNAAATAAANLQAGQVATGTAAADAANRLRSIPSRTVRTTADQNTQNAQAQPAMTKEQLRYWIEANRMASPQLPWPTPVPPAATGNSDE